MVNDFKKNSVKNGEIALRRTASKTVRNFTGKIGDTPLPQSVSVHLDWLSFMVECTMGEPAPDQGPVWVSENTVLEYEKKGTPIFNYSYSVYIDGEPVAKIHTHGKNPKIIKPGSAKLEILNHVLYSTTVLETLENVMIACKMPIIKNVSGLHIAIDGCNHVWEFMNEYVRQNKNRSRPELKTLGRWDKENRVRMKGKANLDCKRFNRKDGSYSNFKVGSARKSLTVYNKTTELEHSHKQYIKDSWNKAGIDVSGTVWRCELRLTSQSIKEIKDFDLKKVNDPNYLLQIFKTQCENFFQFILLENDCNVSRARIIDLFQFEKLKVPILEKIPRAIVRGAYKAQLAIHNAYANVRLGFHRTFESLNAALHHITDNVQLYNLDEWYERKKPKWDEMYLVHAYAPEAYKEQIR